MYDNEELNYLSLQTYDSWDEYEELVARDEQDALYGSAIDAVLSGLEPDEFNDDETPEWASALADELDW